MNTHRFSTNDQYNDKDDDDPDKLMNEEDQEMLNDASASIVTGTDDQPVANSSVCDLECCDIHRNAHFQSLTNKSIGSSKRKQGKKHSVFQSKWLYEHK